MVKQLAACQGDLGVVMSQVWGRFSRCEEGAGLAGREHAALLKGAESVGCFILRISALLAIALGVNPSAGRGKGADHGDCYPTNP